PPRRDLQVGDGAHRAGGRAAREGGRLRPRGPRVDRVRGRLGHARPRQEARRPEHRRLAARGRRDRHRGPDVRGRDPHAVRPRGLGGPMKRSSGFTLLETIIAMGILAIGATTALALLVAATATGRHAEHLVNSSLIADSAFTDVEADLNGGFGPAKLDRLDVAANAGRGAGMGDGPIRAAPPMDPRAASSGSGSTPAPPPTPAPAPKSGKPAAVSGPPRAYAEDPFAKAKTYWWKKDAKCDAYPDYKYDVAITPVGGPPDDPWEFLVEVIVKWTERGQKRDGVYQTILLKKLTHLDNEP